MRVIKIKILKYLSILPLFMGISYSFAGTISPELENQLNNKSSNGNVDIIIEFSDPVNTAVVANLSVAAGNVTKGQIIKSLIANTNITQGAVNSTLTLNGINSKNIWLNNTIAASVPKSLIPQISLLNNVEHIKLDKKFVLDAGSQGVSPSQLDWNITSIGVDSVWNAGATGEGVVIGSMDTGVDLNHPDLALRWRGGNNSWFDPYGIYTTPYDSNGHGTQTTSLMVGGNASGSTIGVAPEAKWIAAKIFDSSNVASISAIHLAFQWMLDPDGDPDTDDGADIVNNSWNFGNSFDQCDYEFQEDISILRSADVAVIFSAGNSGSNPSTSKSPANNEDTVPVGAIDESMNVAFFSSRGPSACDDGAMYPKLMAPGVNVRTADLTFGGAIPNSYVYSSGTSFSAPHVSGALALLLSKYPDSSLGDRETALFDTAVFSGSANDYGYGIIDVDAAIQYMDPVAHPISPSDNIGNNNTPTYIWSSVVDATHYYLWVNDSSGNAIKQWYTAIEVGCGSGEKTCVISPDIPLSFGSVTWWMKSKNSEDNGPWSTPLTFVIGDLPDEAILSSPTGNTATNMPTYEWSAVINTSWYYLWVNDSSGNIIKQWYTAAEVGCGSGEETCTISPNIPLSIGNGSWWVKTYNGAGYGPWSTPLSFANGEPPDEAVLSYPSGNITTNTPTYRWNAVPNTSWYYLRVNDSSGNVIQQWYSATEVGCGSGETTCSVTPVTSLSLGAGSWWVQTYNDVGYGPWSSAMMFFLQNGS